MRIGYIILGMFALAGFFISLIVNIGAYVGINLWAEFPAVQLLHFSAIGLVFATVAAGYNRDFGRRGKGGKVSFNEAFPLGLRLLIYGVSVFTFINFMTAWQGQSGKPNPQRLTGTYFEYTSSSGERVYISEYAFEEEGLNQLLVGDTLELDGFPVLRSGDNGITIFTPISEAEYYEREMPVTRMFSGGWMLFHLVPAVYFLYYKGIMGGKVKRKNDDGMVKWPSEDGNWVTANDLFDT